MTRLRFALSFLVLALLAPLTLFVSNAAAQEYNDTGDYSVWMLDDRYAVPGDQRNDKELGRAIEVHGNVVFVGGMFDRVKPSFTGTSSARSTLVALDRNTGAPIWSFDPNIDGGGIYDMQMSPDGQRLLIAGSFTSVDGNTDARGLASINPTTGRLQTDWQARITMEAVGDVMSVRTMHLIGNDLFVGGEFTHIEQANGSKLYRQRLARLDVNSASVEGWTPSANGARVNAIRSSSDGSRIYLGGMFSSLNGASETAEFAVVNPTNGNLISGFSHGARPYSNLFTVDRDRHGIEDIVDNGSMIMLVGDKGITVKQRSNGSHVRAWYLDGDPQVAQVIDGHIYVGGHFTTSIVNRSVLRPSLVNPLIEANIMVRFNLNNMTLDTGWVAAIHGDSGVWDIQAETDETMWITGGISWAGNRRVDGLARFSSLNPPNPPAVLTCTVVGGNGSASISWTNMGASGYDVSHDGGGAEWITNNSYTDFTPGTNYTVTAWGNGQGGKTATCTNPNPGGGGFTCTVTATNNGVTVSWTGIGANGYDVSEDGATPVWITGTSFNDATPGATYRITSWGNGTNGTTTTCDNPGGPGPGFSCQVSANANGSATVSWTNIGANGYDVSRNGGAAIWRTGTSWTDSTPGNSYTVTAWGNGTNGTTTSC